MAKSLMLNFTGNGKGKTSAALGTVLRALGYGHRVAIVQFIKDERATGERMFFRRCFPDVIFESLGEGLTITPGDHAAAARHAWSRAEELLRTFPGELLVLDELNIALSCGYLDNNAVKQALLQRRADLDVIVTGRNSPPFLREMSDLVSEIVEVKHPYNAGIPAKQGIDY